MACGRWARMQELVRRLFSEAAGASAIQSPLQPLDWAFAGVDAPQAGHLLLKRDDSLPIAGSVKARGGFYEVIGHAFDVGCRAGLFAADAPFTVLLEPDVRAWLAARRLLVASTGNLGLSVGLIGRALGFDVEVHMSRDAKAWKKTRLRDAGARVVEHASDYLSAVHAASQQAASDPACHFVDDEHSRDLFLGYSAAAPEVVQQLAAAQIPVDAAHPLLVYLPCGIGGAPGGIAFGLSMLLGPHVHCFFAEPVTAPCMLAQMTHGLEQPRSVYDLGLSGQTEADGLAVTQASLLVAGLMRRRLSGIFTVEDAAMVENVRHLFHGAGIRLEPSATAGLAGPGALTTSAAGREYLARLDKADGPLRATHLVWATGGSLVPEEPFATWLEPAACTSSPA